MIHAELGKTKNAEITLINPSHKVCLITHKIQNPFCFKIEEEQIQIPPKTKKKVTVIYTPSDLEKPETSEVIFSSKEIGDWNYKFVGMGIHPEAYDQTVVKGCLETNFMGRVYFKNPYQFKIVVNISLFTNERSIEVFDLMT